MKDLKPASLMWVRRMSRWGEEKRVILAQISAAGLALSGGGNVVEMGFWEK